ncbi:unnamed protein product [Lactuca saligna]|uniref:Protein transport protein SEC23 n=1 Tax=Lactuca saligna TaxID=75948 RepID=A0AA36EPV8_LACSI|nr:unnamed protein product [Lactuca saligna]
MLDKNQIFLAISFPCPRVMTTFPLVFAHLNYKVEGMVGKHGSSGLNQIKDANRGGVSELAKQLRRGRDRRQEGLHRRSLFFSGSIGIHSRRGRKDFGPLSLSVQEEEFGGKQSQGWLCGARGSMLLLLRGIRGCLFLVFLTGNECRCVLTIQPAFVFVVDGSVSEDELQELKNELVLIVAQLPENAMVGLIVFYSMVRVYDLGFTECLWVVVLHGEHKPSSSQLLNSVFNHNS